MPLKDILQLCLEDIALCNTQHILQHTHTCMRDFCVLSQVPLKDILQLCLEDKAICNTWTGPLELSMRLNALGLALGGLSRAGRIHV